MSAQDLVLLALIYKYAKTPFSHVVRISVFGSYLGRLLLVPSSFIYLSLIALTVLISILHYDLTYDLRPLW